MTESGMFYVAVCRECGDDLEVPFTSASDRGKWCAAHRDGTGHGQWHIFDIPKEATVPDDNVEEIIGVFSLARSGLGWRATVQLMAGEWTVCREWPTVTEAARDAGNELALLLEAGDTDEP